MTNDQRPTTNDHRPIFLPAIFAGILIAIAGWGFLANPVLGMFLFCVGLIAVVKYRARLYTGTAGFIEGWGDVLPLLLILAGNIVCCMAVAAVSLFSPLALYYLSIVLGNFLGCNLYRLLRGKVKIEN